MSTQERNPLERIVIELMKKQPMTPRDIFSCLKRNVVRAQETFKQELEENGQGIPSEAEVACMGGLVLLECFAAIRTVTQLQKEGINFDQIIGMSSKEIVQEYHAFIREECDVHQI